MNDEVNPADLVRPSTVIDTKVADLPAKWRGNPLPKRSTERSRGYALAELACADELEAALARQEADKMDIMAHRLLYLDHSGEWVTHGRPWVDGRPDPKLLTELVEPNSRWRIEYAYAAPPSAPVGQTIEHMAINRYMPVPAGAFAYKVVAGDGTRSLFSGTKDECQIVARKLTEAFLDGAYAAAPPVAQADDWHARAVAAEKLSVPHGYKLVRDSETPPAAQGVDLDAVRECLGEIADLSTALRHGGPAPEDLHGLSDALEEATSMAYDMCQIIDQQAGKAGGA